MASQFFVRLVTGLLSVLGLLALTTGLACAGFQVSKDFPYEGVAFAFFFPFLGKLPTYIVEKTREPWIWAAGGGLLSLALLTHVACLGLLPKNPGMLVQMSLIWAFLPGATRRWRYQPA